MLRSASPEDPGDPGTGPGDPVPPGGRKTVAAGNPAFLLWPFGRSTHLHGPASAAAGKRGGAPRARAAPPAPSRPPPRAPRPRPTTSHISPRRHWGAGSTPKSVKKLASLAMSSFSREPVRRSFQSRGGERAGCERSELGRRLMPDVQASFCLVLPRSASPVLLRSASILPRV